MAGYDVIQADPGAAHNPDCPCRSCAQETLEEHEALCRCVATSDLGGLSCCDHCMDDCRLGRAG